MFPRPEAAGAPQLAAHSYRNLADDRPPPRPVGGKGLVGAGGLKPMTAQTQPSPTSSARQSLTETEASKLKLLNGRTRTPTTSKSTTTLPDAPSKIASSARGSRTTPAPFATSTSASTPDLYALAGQGGADRKKRPTRKLVTVSADVPLTKLSSEGGGRGAGDSSVGRRELPIRGRREASSVGGGVPFTGGKPLGSTGSRRDATSATSSVSSTSAIETAPVTTWR
jgi:hypothetical protein